MENRATSTGSQRVYGNLSLPFYLALLITLADCAWILSLPSFPSADGPIHLYYVHVLGTLLAKSSPVYAHFYLIRHLVPPYAIYYYGLLWLSKVVPLLLADRLMICFYLLSFLFGFHYLSRAIGPRADVMTLLATPLLLNWPLGMGFVNYCLALSLALWAMGLWVRFESQSRPAARIGFVILSAAVLLAHPVALMILVGVAAAFLVARLVVSLYSFNRLPSGFGADVLTLTLAGLNLSYLRIFLVAHPLNQLGEAPTPVPSGRLQRFLLYIGQHGTVFLFGHSPDILLYRFGLTLLLFIPAALASWQFSKNRSARKWTAGDTFLSLGILLLFGLPFVPPNLNGSFYFADRLVGCIWIAFLLSASGWTSSASLKSHGTHSVSPSNRKDARVVRRADLLVSTGLVALALITELSLLHAADRLLRPAAVAVAALDESTALKPESVGFLLEDPRPPLPAPDGVSWNPQYWSLAHMIEHDDAVLANPPWADVTILPVGPSAALPGSTIPTFHDSLPTQVEDKLLHSPGDLRAALLADTFFLINTAGRPSRPGVEPILRSPLALAQQWSCSDGSWYRLCRRAPVIPEASR